MSRRLRIAITVALGGTLPLSSSAPQPVRASIVLGPIRLSPCTPTGATEQLRCGVATVYEDPVVKGRTLELTIVVIPSRRARAAADPIMFVAGGPGQTATSGVVGLLGTPLRDERDIVLIDQRGTSAQQALNCVLPGSDGEPQGFLETVFDRQTFRRCAQELSARADLRMYSTARAVEDFDAIRAALGYAHVNLLAASYGTRFALTYMRRHPDRVRTAYLSGLVPAAFKNPLYHARAAQTALDSLIHDCEQSASCHAAFPALRSELDALTSALRKAPAAVVIPSPEARQPTKLLLSLVSFAEAARVMMYNPPTATRLPLLIHLGSKGDLTEFALAALRSNRNLRQGLRYGLLQSVICSEDIPRITESEIVSETRGTLLQDSRVRQQRAACEVWPRADVPADEFQPTTSRVPTLLISGTRDPVTPPRWGEEARRSLPNAIHLVVPGGHDARSPCTTQIAAQMIRQGNTKGLDTSCVAGLRYPDFMVR